MRSIIGRRIYFLFFFSIIVITLVVSLAYYFMSFSYMVRTVNERLSGALYAVNSMVDEATIPALQGKNGNARESFQKKIGEYQEHIKLAGLSVIIPHDKNYLILGSRDTVFETNFSAEFWEAYASKSLVLENKFHVVNGAMMKFAYLPVTNANGSVLAVLRSEYDLKRFWQMQMAFFVAIIFFTGLSIIFGFILKSVIQRSVIKPIMELNKSAKLIAGGELDHVIRIKSKNEIEELANNFNQMTQNLKDSFGKIENYNKNLLTQLFTDTLTNLPNRKKFMDDLAMCSNPIVIIFNVDAFQEINDFYGTEVGDFILKEMGNRLKSMNMGVLYRLYKMHADEYTILIDRKVGIKDLEYWGIYLSEEVMDRAFVYRETEIYITVSVGIGTVQKDIASIEGMEIGKSALRNADMALKRAKISRKKYVVYQDFMEIVKEYENNIQWTKKLKNAIKENRIIPYFQPIQNNHTGKIEKYECLMRMIDTNGNIVAPLNFLNIAKKARLYRYLTKMMVEKSFEFFRDNNYEFSLNLSLDDIMDEKTISYIYEILKINKGICPRVVFELLETEDIENYKEVIEFINYVKKCGCKIAIDDFGTGYSNFSHLVHMQVDYIKIDSSLIKNINIDKNSQIITRTIANFARELGLQTISEFVHSKEVYDKSMEMGIDFSQGYYLGEPKEKLIEI